MPTPRKRKILFFIGADWYFCSHRLLLARGLHQAGYEIVVLTHVTNDGERIRKEGFRLVESTLARGSLNPLSDVRAFVGTLRAYRRERPDIAHHVGIKPILYGSLAGVMTSTPGLVNAFAGMGYLFNTTDRKARIVRGGVVAAMKALLNRRNTRVILQSEDARDSMVKTGFLAHERIAVIRGSGVDISEFVPSPEPPGVPVVVLASRMLWDKGVREFVEASRMLKARKVPVRMALVGAPDSANPSAIAVSQLEAWRDDGSVEWWGHRSDMPSVFAQCHVVCLPSYHEGVPKVLIEAAASGRPLIASDIPGCREVARHMENAMLVEPRSASALADAISVLARDKALRLRLGERGRQIAVDEFSIDDVIARTRAVYDELVPA
ncbi:MAG TPA: glycosyltransferase family 4 protein [Gemmatimonadaceae bacterium]|nr:glycosyltransferase family 4 protein [Gemmatimonadaceae bacterium]